MVRYVDLDKIVAEIEKQRNAYIREPSKYKVLSRILSFIDSLEVKEVDLEKVIGKYNGQLSEDALFRIAEQIYNC